MECRFLSLGEGASSVLAAKPPWSAVACHRLVVAPACRPWRGFAVKPRTAHHPKQASAAIKRWQATALQDLRPDGVYLLSRSTTSFGNSNSSALRARNGGTVISVLSPAQFSKDHSVPSCPVATGTL